MGEQTLSAPPTAETGGFLGKFPGVGLCLFLLCLFNCDFLVEIGASGPPAPGATFCFFMGGGFGASLSRLTPVGSGTPPIVIIDDAAGIAETLIVPSASAFRLRFLGGAGVSFAGWGIEVSRALSWGSLSWSWSSWEIAVGGMGTGTFAPTAAFFFFFLGVAVVVVVVVVVVIGGMPPLPLPPAMAVGSDAVIGGGRRVLASSGPLSTARGRTGGFFSGLGFRLPPCLLLPPPLPLPLPFPPFPLPGASAGASMGLPPLELLFIFAIAALLLFLPLSPKHFSRCAAYRDDATFSWSHDVHLK